MNQTELFGEPAKKVLPKPGTGGYAAKPGTGPEGKTCRDCRHYCRRGNGSKTYLKCGLMRDQWTGGPGTDIKAGAAACHYFEART